jgi:hypothetical protein
MPIDFTAKLAEMDKRMRETLADPEYQAKQARIAADLEADAKVQTDHRRKAAGIPETIRPWMDAPWSSLIEAGHIGQTEHAALDFVRQWSRGDKPVAILAGALGRGKTVAMCWAVDQLGGYYVEASDICRSGWSGDDYWDRWLRTPTLALDELGMETMDAAGWWEAKLHRLLSGRLLNGKRTLIGTNLTRSQLRQRYGSEAMARTWDRLEVAWSAQVFVGPSLRKVAP